MPDVLSREDAEFLTRLDEMGREGLSQSEAASKLGVSPSTVGYRVIRTYRLKIVPYFRIEDARTGETLSELIERGEIVIADDKPAEAVG